MHTELKTELLKKMRSMEMKSISINNSRKSKNPIFIDCINQSKESIKLFTNTINKTK